MSKKNRERREDGPRPQAATGGGSGTPNWLPTVLSIVAIVFCAFLYMDAKRAADGLKKAEVDIAVLSKQLAARPAQAQQQQRPSGPDPAKVYTVSLDGSPVKGKLGAPITIAEFSDYQ